MTRKTIEQLQQGYQNGDDTPTEIAQTYLRRSEARNGELNAFITVTNEKALEDAAAVEHSEGPLRGVPVTYKDLVSTKGIRTTSGSAIERDYVPNQDAPVVTTLRHAGAVQIGKVNLHEYAFGITSNNPHYGPVRNPWNEQVSPGGSSGGSAAAIAADLCMASIGTDTGGSIRIPAASCGVVGLKPTFGLISTVGVTPLSWTLDHVGPLTANVSDMFRVMSVFLGESLLRHRTTDIRGLRIGVPKRYFNERLDADVYRLYQSALRHFERLGAILIELDVPGASEAVPLTFTLAAAEAGYVHRERMATSLDLFGSDVKAVLESSAGIPASAYIDALQQRQVIADGISAVFDHVDVIVTPTLPTTPKAIGQDEVVIGGVKEDLFGCMIRYTCPFNLTGHPALAVPCGVAEDGLPVGIQIVGPHANEARLLKVGYAYEQTALTEFYELRDRRCVK